MTLTLNSFSRTLLLLISVSFSSLALFFHLDMALCPFCLCTSFYVLGMLAPFPLLENSGLLEKRLWCPEVQCPLFARTRWSRSFSYVCCVHPPAVAEMHFHSVHLAAMALFVFFWVGFGPCAVPEAILDLSWSDSLPAPCPSARTTEHSPCIIWRGFHWCVVPSVRFHECPQSFCWGCSDLELQELSPCAALCGVSIVCRASSHIRYL